MRAAKLIASNLLLLGGAALALELVFGNWLQQNPAKRIPEIARQAGRTHTFRTNGLTGEDVEVKFSRDSEGFRGKKNDSGLRQILVIGGSTAIEFVVPEPLTWAEQLEARLNKKSKSKEQPFDVINAGVAGQTLLGNKLSTDLWLKHTKSIEPEIIIIYYGHNDAIYTLADDTKTTLIDPDSKEISLKDQLLVNSAFAMLGREMKGNIAAWALNNRHLFDYQNTYLPKNATEFSSQTSDIKLNKSLYPQKLNGLITSVTTAWPNAKTIFVAQSNPNCFFTNHSQYHAERRNQLCEDLLAVHRHTRDTIEQFQNEGYEQLHYEPLFLDNPYDRSGSSDAIHTNSRGSAGIAEALTPRIQKHLNP